MTQEHPLESSPSGPADPDYSGFGTPDFGRDLRGAAGDGQARLSGATPAAKVYGPATTYGGPGGQRRRVRRGPLGWIADRRGLTFLGAVLLAGVIGTVGGLLDAGASDWVGTAFFACFITGCVLAALLAHREDLVAVVFLPPVLFVAIASLVGAVQAVRASASLKSKVPFQVGYAMSFGAKTLWYASGVTLVVALLRLAIQRRPRQRPVPARS